MLLSWLVWAQEYPYIANITFASYALGLVPLGMIGPGMSEADNLQLDEFLYQQSAGRDNTMAGIGIGYASLSHTGLDPVRLAVTHTHWLYVLLLAHTHTGSMCSWCHTHTLALCALAVIHTHWLYVLLLLIESDTSATVS